MTQFTKAELLKGLGEVVRRRRRTKSLEQFASDAGIKKQTLYDLEEGKTKNPHQRTVEKIAKAFRITWEQLHEEAEAHCHATTAGSLTRSGPHVVAESSSRTDHIGRISGAAEYVDRIIEHYENYERFKARAIFDLIGRADLHKYYVALNAREISGRWHGKIEGFVAQWLADAHQKHLSLLGDFGSGKSSFCLKFVYELAKAYRSDPKQRVPLYIPLSALKGFVDQSDLRDRLMKVITRYKLHLGSFDEFQIQLESGAFVLVLDGFDEMTSGYDRPRTRRNLEAINHLAAGNGKVILTCRAHYFTTQKEATAALSSAHDTELMRIVRAQPASTVLIIEELSERQIIRYLRKHTVDWKPILRKIRTTYDLRDLAKRPLLLWMIVETKEQLMGRLSVNAADLYDAYTRIWIEHEDWRSVMNPEQKAEFMERLALEMFRQDEKQAIHYRDLSKSLREHFEGRMAPGTDDIFEHDVRTCSFLNRDDAGYYRFIHKSFMEFFVARRFSEELPKRDFSNFDRQLISPATAGFLTALLKEHHRTTVERISGWIDETRATTFEQVGYRGANALTVLRASGDLRSLAGRDFSGTVLRGANFQNVDLAAAAFKDADLKQASFNHAILEGADFRGANLEDVPLGENNAIVGFDASPNDRQLAVGTSEGEIKIYDTTSKSYVSTLRGHGNAVKAVAYSPDGDFLVSGGVDGSVRLWSVVSLEELVRMRGHRRGVRSVAFSPEARRVASGSYDATVRIWKINADDREGMEERRLEGHQGPVYALSFDATGKRLVSSGADRTARVWNVEDGAQLKIIAHRGEVDAIALSHDGTRLAAADGQNAVRIWDFERFEDMGVRSRHSALIFSICFSPNDSMVASGDQAGRIVIWDLMHDRAWWEIPDAHKGVVNGLRYLDGGSRLASVSEDGTLKVWDVQGRRPEPLLREGVEDDLHVKGLRIGGATGLSDARIAFLISKGAVI
jgi:transcriptional regulator with XRE-family HTH domain